MSYIKDIQESHDALKGIVSSLFLMPFWYLTIFLVNHELYTNNNFTTLVVISFVLSITSFIFMVIVALLSDSPDDNSTFFEVTIFCVSLLWLWKVILLFVVYTIAFLFKQELYFYSYIVIYFFPIIILILIAYIENRKNKKKKNKNR